MVGEKLKEQFDREPIWRKAEDKISNPGNKIRDSIDNVAEGQVPRFKNRNFGNGVGAGIVGAGVATVLEDTVGLPFGSSTDTIDVEPVDGAGTRYVVNVNAPFESMAEARAFIDAGTGFSSVLTDQLQVENVEVIGTRTLRDTYQVELIIED